MTDDELEQTKARNKAWLQFDKPQDEGQDHGGDGDPCDGPPQHVHALKLKQQKNETKAQSLGRHLLQPEIKAAITTRTILGNDVVAENLDINALVDELNRQTTLIRRRDLSRAEDMLASQAHLLDQLFSKLVNVGMQNLYQYPKTAETFLKLAMKAQGQCRTSWEAISKIQNPPVTNHVQQQNVAHSQQINNRPNQLSGDSIELLPNKRNEGAAIPIDPSVEAMGEVYRPKDATGQA